MTFLLPAILAAFPGIPDVPAKETAADLVKAKRESLLTWLRGPDAGDLAKADAILDGYLDYPAFAKSVLGDEWEKRTDPEKAAFVPAMKQFFRQAWIRQLKSTADFTVAYGEEKVEGEEVLVPTQLTLATNSKDDPRDVKVRLGKSDGVWKVRDVISEDVSLVRSLRSQCLKVLKKDGFDELLQKLKAKIDAGNQ